MLREDGPHLLALALKFPLIHRKHAQVKETNNHCLVETKAEDEAALLIHFTKEQ